MVWLLITIGVEFTVAARLVRRRYGPLLLYSGLINGLTWPLANLAYLGWVQRAYPGQVAPVFWLPFLTVEVVVLFTEAILWKYLAALDKWKAFQLSAIANLITAALSFLAW